MYPFFFPSGLECPCDILRDLPWPLRHAIYERDTDHELGKQDIATHDALSDRTGDMLDIRKLGNDADLIVKISRRTILYADGLHHYHQMIFANELALALPGIQLSEHLRTAMLRPIKITSMVGDATGIGIGEIYPGTIFERTQMQTSLGVGSWVAR